MEKIPPEWQDEFLAFAQRGAASKEFLAWADANPFVIDAMDRILDTDVFIEAALGDAPPED